MPLKKMTEELMMDLKAGLEAVKSVITKRPRRVSQPSLKDAGPDWVAHG